MIRIKKHLLSYESRCFFRSHPHKRAEAAGACSACGFQRKEMKEES